MYPAAAGANHISM